MITIYDDAILEAARDLITDPTLTALVDRIVRDAKASDLWQVTCIVIIEPGDPGDELEDLLGFDPLIGPLGEEGGEFIPWWDRLEHHPGCFELLHTTGTEFAFYLLVPDAGGDRSGLAALCRQHGGK